MKNCIPLWIVVAIAAFLLGGFIGNQITYSIIVRDAVANGVAEYEVNQVTGAVVARWKIPNRQAVTRQSDWSVR